MSGMYAGRPGSNVFAIPPRSQALTALYLADRHTDPVVILPVATRRITTQRKAAAQVLNLYLRISFRLTPNDYAHLRSFCSLVAGTETRLAARMPARSSILPDHDRIPFIQRVSPLNTM